MPASLLLLLAMAHPELPTIDGKTAQVSDFAGKKLVLIHFASW